jgi:hypothetical protein
LQRFLYGIRIKIDSVLLTLKILLLSGDAEMQCSAGPSRIV